MLSLLPPGSPPRFRVSAGPVQTFPPAAQEHLRVQKFYSVDGLAAAVGTVTHGATVLQESAQSHTHTHTHPRMSSTHIHKHTLSLSPSSLFLSMQP